MGLDMYLRIRKEEYASDYTNVEKCIYPEELKGLETDIVRRNFRAVQTFTDYLVGYWRKANAIHHWFVEECAEGVDECQDIVVSLKQIGWLIDACNEVLKDNSRASDVLPTQDGFFFGGTDYDEWYFKEIQYTKDLLEKVRLFIENDDRYSLIYNASW